jgi:RimJ/RimL family protein N-acetyltransferase
VIEGDGVRLRRAEASDVDFLVRLLRDAEVEPYLALVSARDRGQLLEEIERSQREPGELGCFVIEAPDAREWQPAGTLRFEVRNRRSRIANLGGLAVDPAFRGRRLGDQAARLIQRHLLLELGFHRLELEIYGFNERAIAHAERVGFVREGVKRRAYLRDGRWEDGVLFGLLREDLEDVSSPR